MVRRCPTGWRVRIASTAVRAQCRCRKPSSQWTFKQMAGRKPGHLTIVEALSFLLPDHREMHDGLHGLFHVLSADPFEPRVKRVLAGKDVGAGQTHEGQARAVGAAADR